MSFFDDLVKGAQQFFAPEAQVVNNVAHAVQPVANNVVNFGAGVVNGGAQIANTGIGTSALLANRLDAGLASFLHNQNQINMLNRQAAGISNTWLKPGSGLLGQGGMVTGQQLVHNTPLQSFTQGAGAGAQAAPYFIGAPEGKLVNVAGNFADKAVGNFAGKFASDAAANVAGKVAGKTAQYATQGAVATPFFGGANAIQQYAQTGKVDPMQALQAGVTGGMLTAAGGAGGDLAKFGGKQVVKAGNNFADHVNAAPMPPSARVAEAGFVAGPKATGFQDAQAAGKVFDGVDGKPRFEVDDSGAKWKDFYKTVNQGGDHKLGDILDHPQLFNQYPELKDVTVNINKAVTNDGTRGQAGKSGIRLNTAAFKGTGDEISNDMKGTLLHEAQHLIQGKEKFASGGGPEQFMGDLQALNKSRWSELDDVNAQIRAEAKANPSKDGAGSTEYQRLMSQRNDLIKLLNETQDQYGSVGGKAIDKYKNLAGEAEARAVQARMNMSDAERYTNGKQASDYGMSHRPNEDGGFGYDITKNVDGEFVPKDVYDHPEHYFQMKGEYGKASKESMDAVKSIRNNPEAKVTVYRSGTKNELNGGDWISLSKKYAEMHQESNGERGDAVHSFTVQAKDLKWPGDDINEFGYYPANPKPHSTFYDSLDVPKKDLIVRHDKGGVASSVVAGKEPAGKANESAPNTKLSRFANRTVPKSPEVPADVQKMVKDEGITYETTTNKDRIKQADAATKGMSEEQAGIHALQMLENKKFDTKGQDKVTAIQIAKRLQGSKSEANRMVSAEIYGQLSEHLSNTGQEMQAATMLAARTPEGIKYGALRDLKKAGVEVTPEINKSLDDQIAAIKKTKPGSDERKIAVGKLAQTVSKHIPAGKISNMVSLWKAGLLSGTKTTEGNLLSNSTFATLKGASDPVTVLADKAMSLLTGKRTVTMTQRGRVSGSIEGFKKGAITLKTGIDLRTASDKYDQHAGINFKNPTVQKVLGKAQHVFDWMGAQDQPFYYSQLKNSLYDLAKADGLNQGLHGKELIAHMNNTVANPSEKMLQTAVDDANKSVLSYDTIAAKAVQGMHKGIDAMPGETGAGKEIAHAVVSVLAPFVRVPTAFLARSIDFTPIGITHQILRQVVSNKFDQRALSKAIGEGMTGTGVIALGVMLAQNGQLSGDYPKSPKEQQRWKAEKISPNSVKLGNQWVSMNYLGPIGMLFGAGKKFNDAVQAGGDAAEAVGQAVAGFGQTLLGQSFLQGMSGFINAAQNPTQYWQSYVNSQAGSVIPSIINDFANLSDDKQRQVNGPTDAIQNRIPLVRQFGIPGVKDGLNVKQDIFGNQLTQNPWAAAFNGLRPSEDQAGNNPVIAEIGRLHDVNPSDTTMNVTPVPIKKSITLIGSDGKSSNVAINDQQRYDLQHQVGQAVQGNWDQFIKSPQYQQLDDKSKAAALSKIATDTTNTVENQWGQQNNLGVKKLTNSQKNMAAGTGDLSQYAKSLNTDGTSATIAISSKLDSGSKDILTKYNNMGSDQRAQNFNTQKNAEYLYNLAKYNNDKANGTLDQAQEVKAQFALAKDKVGAQFDKNIRELYGLSKAQISQVLQNDPNAQQLADQVMAYGDALANAGIEKNKFAHGFAAGGSGGGRRGGKASTSMASAITGVAKGAKAASNAKVKMSSSGFRSKISTAKIQQFKKPTSTKVRVA